MNVLPDPGRRVARIAQIEVELPERIVTNDDLALEQGWDMERVAAKTGVFSRHIADDTALDLAERAARRVDGPIDAILFCTQTPDQLMPPNSALLQARLGLSENVFALDFNLACSGFVYGLGLAQGLISAGMASNVLLVTADTYSRLIRPDDRGPRTLFGDGAAATMVRAGQPGLIDLIASTSGKDHAAFDVPSGEAFLRMDGMRVLAWVQTHVPAQVKALLRRNGLEPGDIDTFVFHQASGLALDALDRILGVRSFRKISDVGNTVSASIPMALAAAIEQGKVGEGSRVILSGFGVGLSCATALIAL